MPDVSGKGLVAAYQALNYDNTVHLKDGRGAGRHVLWPGSWKVCDQYPKAGTPFSHRPITLTVVKARESCGAGR
ncbi:PASTA domain-containing protein [Streptomyces sp. RGM 3693]|uniref:PASTA domain-containing protein n=1 Tax=Streptomyces sp. RGM 3693 TaxID=3413284 RepID=UPI003D2B4347